MNRIDVTEFRLKLETEEVLSYINCTKENPRYRELRELLERIWKQNLRVFQPKAYIQRMKMDDKIEGYACLMTLGESVSKELEHLMQEDMMKAYLFDSLASQLIFQMDEQLQEKIRDLCRMEHHGIAGRWEAPLDFPLDRHQEILEKMKEQGPLSIQLTSGYMLQPEKSMIVFYPWSKDESCLKVDHDCTNCPNRDCSKRKKRINL